jgi:hypothetical protein
VAPRDTSLDLYWIPLGAGTRSVRCNGIVYEAIAAAIARRSRRDIFHAALIVTTPSGRFTIEMTPVPDDDLAARGVVAQGPVGLRVAGRLRLFRYEVRCWHDGVIPDLHFAVASPIRLTDDSATAHRLLDVLPAVPTLTWGRDELDVGDMWSCNSIISWALTMTGIDGATVAFPPNGRAPGWDAGIFAARAEILRLAPSEAVAGTGIPLYAKRHLRGLRSSPPSHGPGARVHLQGGDGLCRPE